MGSPPCVATRPHRDRSTRDEVAVLQRIKLKHMEKSGWSNDRDIVKASEPEQLPIMCAEIIRSPAQRCSKHLIVFRMRRYPMDLDVYRDDEGHHSKLREELADLGLRQSFAEVAGIQRVREFCEHVLRKHEVGNTREAGAHDAARSTPAVQHRWSENICVKRNARHPVAARSLEAR